MLSSVIIARNDNYGGNLNERAVYCLNSFIKLCDEVIYVDWNSPNNISLFTEIKDYVEKTGRIRHIQVTNEFVFNLGLPSGSQAVVEVLARNIGIRRAKGDFIISSNIDIIAPLKLTFQLDENCFYIIARRDISLEELRQINNPQEYLFSNYDGYFCHGYSGINKQDVWSIIDCCGDFQLASRKIWFDIRGFEEQMVYRGFSDSNVQRKAANLGYKLVPIFDCPVFHIRHEGGFGGSGIANDAGRFVLNFNQPTMNNEAWGFSNVSFKEEVW